MALYVFYVKIFKTDYSLNKKIMSKRFELTSEKVFACMNNVVKYFK